MDFIPNNSHTYIITPETQTPHYSVKRTVSSVPLVPGLYKYYWIMRSLTCLSKSCPLLLIDSTTIALVCTALASGQPSHKHTAKESSRAHLHSAQQHEYALPRLLEMYRKPPKYRRLYNPDTQQWSHGVWNRGFPLYSLLLELPSKHI